MKRPNQSPSLSGSFIAQHVQRLDHAVHRGRVDLDRVLAAAQVRIGVAHASSAAGSQVIGEVAEQFGRGGARMPNEKVMQASSATPWCGTPGGR